MNRYILFITLSIILYIGVVVVAFTPSQDTVFFEDFNAVSSLNSRWIKSSASQADVEYRAAESPVDPADKGLLLPTLAKRYAVTSKLSKPVDNTNKDLVVQYEVKLQNGLDCGGAYIKLYQATDSFDITSVSGETPYSIMFGPDKCGSENRIHFIVKRKNPINGALEEKLITARPPIRTDTLSHLYTLQIKPDNTFEILVDRVSVLVGDFHKDFTPAFNPPKQIDDPNDFKPEDWVDEAKIADPEAKKPEDWDESQPKRIVDETATKPIGWRDDEPEMIADPSVAKPEEWDDDEDGEWEPPMIPNPNCDDGMCGEWKQPVIDNPLYKGKWVAPQIDNPLYKGEWKPKQIDNPEYFEVENPYIVEKIGAIGVEVWTMSGNILFDNFIISHDFKEADRLAEEIWSPKNLVEKERQAALEAEKAKKMAAEYSYVDQALAYGQFAIEYARLNPMMGAVTVIGCILPFFLLCGGRKKPAQPQQPQQNKIVIEKEEEKKEVESSSSEDEEEQEEVEEKKEVKKSNTPTKRTNKVK